MTKYFTSFLLSICIAFTVTSFAQQKELDSLDAILAHINPESVQLQKLDSLIEFYAYRNSETHIYLAEKSLEIGIKSSDHNRESLALIEKALYYRLQGSLDSSFVQAEKALDVATKLGDYRLINKAKKAQAYIFSAKGDYLKEIEIYNELLTSYEAEGDEIRNILITKYNLAGTYLLIQDFDKAKIVTEELYNHPEIKKDKEFLAEVCLQLGGIHGMFENYDEALAYAIEAEANAKRPYYIAVIQDLLGSIYKSKGQHKKAATYYKKALAFFIEMGDTNREIATKVNYGASLFASGNYLLAEKQLLENIELFKKEETANHAGLEHNYSVLSELYEKINKPELALDYFKKSNVLHDSIIGIEKQNAISEFEIKYETEKTKREKQEAEAQTALEKEKNVRQRNFIIGISLIAGLILLSSLLYFSRMKSKKKAEIVTLELHEAQKRLALEKQYRDSELKALKAQMNPHFIFNALNSIQEYIILNKKNLAGDYLGKFADLMRKYLHHSDAGTLTIADEIESLEMYLDLEALRFEDTLTYSFNVSENINREHLRIPTMLIQPYVENALKHGLLHRKTGRKLSISFKKENDKTITCLIEDNGVGRERAAAIKAQTKNMHASFATKATENRLNLLNYEKERKIGVEIIDLFEEDGNARGTRVVLNIPTTTH